MSLSAAQRKQAHLSGQSSQNAMSYLYLPNQLTDRNLTAPVTGGMLTVTNTAYWLYIGQATRDLYAQYIYFFVTAVAVGTQAQELVIATSSSGPDRAAKTLSVKAVATAVGDYSAATGSYANTTAFNYHIPGSAHVWLGCRFAWTSTPTQPTVAARGLDLNQGAILRTATPGVLAVGDYTGALVTQSTTLTTAMCPDLVLSAS